MRQSDASKMAREMIKEFIPGAYFGGFNNRKNSLGVAKLKNGMEFIELSSVYVSGADEESVKNTIAHECAHILAHRTYGTFKHDKYFYSCCKVTGAEQTRVNRDPKVQEAMKGVYGLVLIVAGEVKEVFSSSWHRRPSKSLFSSYIPGRQKETLGKLYYCRTESAKIGKKVDTKNIFWQN